MDSLLGVFFKPYNHLSLSGSSTAKLEENKKVKRYIILITTPEETIIVDAHISDCSVTSVSGEPSTDSLRVLTTENPSYDNYNDDDHDDDDDVADLLRCFQNVR